jgi:arthrofactin-type cyclic lipopeptide synthetase C
MSNGISTAAPPAGRPPYCAPSNDLERSLVAIWSETLQLDGNTIGIHDTLKDLGGMHSLVIVQLVARIAVAFGIELPISEIIAQPSISQIAVLVESARKQKAAPA